MLAIKITRHTNVSEGELIDWHKNISPNGWIERKLIGRYRDNLLDRNGKQWQEQVKMLVTKVTVETEEQPWAHY